MVFRLHQTVESIEAHWKDIEAYYYEQCEMNGDVGNFVNTLTRRERRQYRRGNLVGAWYLGQQSEKRYWDYVGRGF